MTTPVTTTPTLTGTLVRLQPITADWADAHDRLVLAVVDHSSGAVAGEVVLNDWDETNRSCGFRMLIGAAGRGRGLGTGRQALRFDGARADVHHLSVLETDLG